MSAALVGAGGVVVGTIISALLGIWAEHRRAGDQEGRDAAQRQHELEMRELELREDHRSRLHAERRAAYAEFYRCYRRYDVAALQVAEALKEIRRDPDDGAICTKYIEAVESFARASPPLTESVTRLELVASTPVAEAAAGLGDEATDSINGMDTERHADPEQHRYRMGLREVLLKRLIRKELELDR